MIEPMHIEPELYPSFVDIVVNMYSKIRERLGAQAFQYNGMYVSVNKITRKIAVHPFEDQSVFNTSSDLNHFLSCDLEQNQTGVIMSEKDRIIFSILTTL